MTLDLSTLFHTSVGFDHLDKILEEYTNSNTVSNYPPYNIVKINEQHYRISIAVAGFEKEDVDITLHDTLLKIRSTGGKKLQSVKFIYKGIANRSFEKKFQLAENIKIKAASLDNGLLNIDLLKTPPQINRPVKIEIK